MDRRRPSVQEDHVALAPTRIQTKTALLVAPDELETVHDEASNHAAAEDVKAFLLANGISDEGTALGDLVVSEREFAPKVLPAPRIESIGSKTVHAYCEPLLPFLPVEDLAEPLPDSAIISDADPILEYLREVRIDFSPAIEPTALHFTPPPQLAPLPLPQLPLRLPAHLAPQPMGPEPTLHEQAAIGTAVMRYRGPAKSNFSARVLTVKKRRAPLWAAALIGAAIGTLLLTSSVFTVEVLASKAAAKKNDPPAEKPKPWVMPK
jgi:hypothetical protein